MTSSGIAMEADCKAVRIGQENKTVYMLGLDNSNLMFKFDIHCMLDLESPPKKMHFFFNVAQRSVLVVSRGYDDSGLLVSEIYRCVGMKFWLTEDDTPILSVYYFYDQQRLISLILESFKQQLFAHQLDETINS